MIYTSRSGDTYIPVHKWRNDNVIVMTLLLSMSPLDKLIIDLDDGWSKSLNEIIAR